jgi:methionyl-tRNA formyltransferase
MQPWPLCSTTWISTDPASKGPLRLIIHQTRPVESPEQGPPGTVVAARADRLIVAAGAAAVRLLLLQLPGKKPVSAADFLRGHRVLPGDAMKS